MASELTSSNSVPDARLGEHLAEVEDLLKANLISYMGPIQDDAPGVLKDIGEQIKLRPRTLAVLAAFGVLLARAVGAWS